MAGEDGRGRRSCQTVAVVLILCALAPSLTCFSLGGLSKSVEQDKEASDATVMEVRTGSILFNGKELDSQSGSASATARQNDGLLMAQSDGTGVLEQTSQLEDAMAKEAAWRHLNSSLHCGRNKMKVKAMGPGAAHLQLDMDNARPLPLSQVPDFCGYLMKQNALGLVLVVPFNGCNIIQENGNYVLPMSWMKTPVKFTCPRLTSSATTPASTSKSAKQPWKLPLPHGLLSLNRRKRQTNLPIYDPRHPYFAYWYYYYYLYRLMQTPAPSTAKTTAKPDTTTMTTKPSTEKPTQTQRPVYPNYPYLYYPYYPYYPYYLLPNVPVTTTPPTTTANATTGPTTTEMTTTAEMTTTSATSAASTTTSATSAASTTTSATSAASTTSATSAASTTTSAASTAASTTTSAASTTKTTQKPFYPPYYPYPYPYPYFPPGQVAGMPDNADLYYSQIIQHYYGKPPYPQNPNTMQTTLPPTTGTTTTATTDGTTTTATTDGTTTTATTDGTTTTATMKPTTAPTTTKACTKTTKPITDKYTSPVKPFVPYDDNPFKPYIEYRSNKAGKLPDYPNYMPQAGYKSGFQPRAHPPPHPGFNYWQPVPWFPHATGQDELYFDWKNLQPKKV